MALSIRNPQAEKLAKEIIALDGGNVTQVIINALQDQLERLRRRTAHVDIEKEIMNISRRCSSIPDIDKRDPDEILGYNSNGVNNNGY
jgi:antitoxin VapB